VNRLRLGSITSPLRGASGFLQERESERV